MYTDEYITVKTDVALAMKHLGVLHRSYSKGLLSHKEYREFIGAALITHFGFDKESVALMLAYEFKKPAKGEFQRE